MIRFHSLPALLFWLPFFSWLSAASGEPPALPITAGARATVMPAGAVWTFPAAHLLSDDTPLTHTFLLRNGTKKPLRVERVAASCECISARIGGTTLLPAAFPAGAVVPVSVRLSPRRLVSGPFSKSLWLYWPGGPREGLRLELRGTVQDDAALAGAAAH